MAYSFALISVLLLSLSNAVSAQPSPEVQKRIAAAIAKAANETNPDYTAFVNPFIGTGTNRCHSHLMN